MINQMNEMNNRYKLIIIKFKCIVSDQSEPFELLLVAGEVWFADDDDVMEEGAGGW